MKKLSRFVHIFQREGQPHFALYHAGSIKTIFLENKDMEMIRRWRVGVPTDEENLARDLEPFGMIVEDGDDDEAISRV